MRETDAAEKLYARLLEFNRTYSTAPRSFSEAIQFQDNNSDPLLNVGRIPKRSGPLVQNESEDNYA